MSCPVAMAANMTASIASSRQPTRPACLGSQSSSMEVGISEKSLVSTAKEVTPHSQATP